MQIQINTGHNIDGNEALVAYVRNETEHGLSRFSDHITRVEVHLSDEKSDKKVGNGTMRCVIEARIEGRHPIAVTNQAATLDQAVKGAANKLTRLIESTIGRIKDRRGRRVEPSPSELDEPEE
jgi:ribosomal subunit interface protein